MCGTTKKVPGWQEKLQSGDLESLTQAEAVKVIKHLQALQAKREGIVRKAREALYDAA